MLNSTLWDGADYNRFGKNYNKDLKRCLPAERK